MTRLQSQEQVWVSVARAACPPVLAAVAMGCDGATATALCLRYSKPGEQAQLAKEEINSCVGPKIGQSHASGKELPPPATWQGSVWERDVCRDS